MSSVRLEGLEELQAKLAELSQRNHPAMLKAADAACRYVLRIMQTQFLNNQVIGRKSHALHNFWHVRPIASGALLGTHVPYAKVQEYGKKSKVFIPEYRRRSRFTPKPGESRSSFTKRRTRFQESPAGAFKHTVKGHSRRLNLEPRRFLRGAVAQARPQLTSIAAQVWRREVAV